MLLNWDSILLLTPGVLGGFGLLVITSRFQHYLTLPACLIAMPALFFFLTVFIGGSTMDELRTDGWIAETTAPEPFYAVWELFGSTVHFSVIIEIVPQWLAMVFVVAFSSCLDVAAISLDLGTRLDYNHELKVVGTSNCISGLLGGYTGSYIFSLTIFNLRQGLKAAAGTSEEADLPALHGTGSAPAGEVQAAAAVRGPTYGL